MRTVDVLYSIAHAVAEFTAQSPPPLGALAAMSLVPSAGVVHALVWAATLCGAFGVLNLVPFSYEEPRGGPVVRTDGRLALDALAVQRGRSRPG